MGIEAWGVMALCGSLGEVFRASLGGEVDESVVVFVRCAVLVGSFLGKSCFKFFEEWTARLAKSRGGDETVGVPADVVYAGWGVGAT